jgi:hypothetical protein
MIWARLWRPVSTFFLKATPLPEELLQQVQNLPQLFLPAGAEADIADAGNFSFCFLNKNHRFENGVDWGFLQEGLLWNYHLNSFAWLESVAAPEEATDALLKNRAAAMPKRGNDGYPTSRRLRHVVRYLLMQKTRDPALVQMLWQDAHRLLVLPETQLGANHLLENYLSLWAAGMLFQHPPFLQEAEAGLRRELPKQFLRDGAHYERSTHYTAQLIAALLRCLALAKALHWPAADSLVTAGKSVVARSLGWLKQMQFPDGQMPAFGDAHRRLWPALADLKAAASKLQIEVQKETLSDSGYRVLENKDFSLCANVGTAAPAFQPGHSHADALSFVLYFRGKPLICDVGISTYERDARRHWERSTAAHNTLEVNGQNSAEIWAAFRMGRRARVKIVAESATEISAVHNGYRHLKGLHHRQFSVGEQTVAIQDFLTGNFKEAFLRLHFPPEITPQLQGENTLLAGNCRLTFTGLEEAKLEPYEWAAGFNERLPAVCFSARLKDCAATLLFKAATLPL